MRPMRGRDPLSAESNPWVIEHEENRTPKEYESEVEEYLDTRRERLPKAVKTLRMELSPAAMSKVRI